LNKNEWIVKCNHWKEKWPVIQPEYFNDENGINLYAVLDAVNRHSAADDVIMGDAGSISYAGPVALKAKGNQKFIFSPAQADMGWALPASIGVALSTDKNVIPIIGDGSFMSNIQELAVVREHNLNIKFIILNNSGYLSIKNTQTKYFEGRVFGTSSNTGLWFPNFKEIAKAFDLEYLRVETVKELEQLMCVFESKKSFLVDCICTADQEILPAQALKNGKQCGLHDMTPFLSDEELTSEMIITL